jgi:hypothetical protein
MAAQTPAGVKIANPGESRGRDVNPADLFYSDSQPREGSADPIFRIQFSLLWVQLWV